VKEEVSRGAPGAVTGHAGLAAVRIENADAKVEILIDARCAIAIPSAPAP